MDDIVMLFIYSHYYIELQVIIGLGDELSPVQKCHLEVGNKYRNIGDWPA